MRKIITKREWLIDLMLFRRDTSSLHLFMLVVLKGPKYIIRTPDFRVPMPVKPMAVKSRRTWKPFVVIGRMKR